ncbi:hypothetical protein ACLB2K_037786 [Fragaria x ananassa]
MNVRGARSQNGCIGAGGVLRDHNGNWVSGFTASLGKGSVIEAESWDLLLGLKLAGSLYYNSMLIESDSEVLIMNMIEQRGINMVADILSNSSLGSEFGFNNLLIKLLCDSVKLKTVTDS